MKTKDNCETDTLVLQGDVAMLRAAAAASLDERAEKLFHVLQEVQEMAEDLTDEQFCGLVHQAVTACGFADALDAWVSLLEVTERKIDLIDFRDLVPRPPDWRD